MANKTLYLVGDLSVGRQSYFSDDLAWLAQRDIRYEVREIRGPNGVMLNHVFLGGYQKSQELQEAR